MKKIFNNKKYISYFKKQSQKIATIFLIVSVFLNILGVKEIFAYYNDIEKTQGNYFSASKLDFILTNNNLEKFIGSEVLGEISHASVIIPEDGSLPMQYNVSVSVDTDTSDVDFCNGLTVEAKLNGISKYLGPLPSLSNGVTDEFGSWEFRFDLPPTFSIPDGVKCNAEVSFLAWREDIINKEDSSWYDEETLNISLTSRMVVLNEIYAKPNSGIVPMDREYIELYNNGSTSVDVLGWQISEIAGTTEKFYPVVVSDAVSGEVMPYDGTSTIIPSGGFLVLEFGGNASHLNDGGDTVKLYDDSTNLLDAHTYLSIPAGKSVVRYPDGIGFWVDPEATPGVTNTVSMEDLREAGFSDEMIFQVMELMDIKNIALTEDIKQPQETIEEIIPEETETIKPDEEIIVDEELETDNVELPTETETLPVEETIKENTVVIKDEEIIQTEEKTNEEIINDFPPIKEPEDNITTEENIEETPISEVIEPEEVNPENTEVSNDNSIAKQNEEVEYEEIVEEDEIIKPEEEISNQITDSDEDSEQEKEEEPEVVEVVLEVKIEDSEPVIFEPETITENSVPETE